MQSAPGLFLAVGRFVAVFSTFDAELGSVNFALAFACEMSIVPAPETLDGPLDSFYAAINSAYLEAFLPFSPTIFLATAAAIRTEAV